MQRLYFQLLTMLFATVATPDHQGLNFRSDVAGVTVEDGTLIARQLKLLIANDTKYKILLLRGIVCVGKEPGVDPEEPGDGCREIYFGKSFLPGKSMWSEPEWIRLPLNPDKAVNVRILRIQTVEVFHNYEISSRFSTGKRDPFGFQPERVRPIRYWTNSAKVRT